MLTNKIRVAFIGLGDHAVKSHFKHLYKMDNVDVIGAFDPNKDAIRTTEKEYGAKLRIYSSAEEIFDDKEIDAILISSPDKFHTEQLMKAVESKKHVFCEKPLSSNDKEIKDLELAFKIAEQNNTVITSCHPRRCDTPYMWVKDNLNNLSAKFGNVIKVDLDFSYHEPSNEKRDLHGESMLQDHANHEIDYINFLLGHSNFKAWKQLDEFDRYNLSGQREDGITFNFMGTRRLDNSIYPEYIDIRFERGALHIDTYNQANSYIDNHETCERTSIDSGATEYDLRFRDVNEKWVSSILKLENNYLSKDDMLINTGLSVAFQNIDIWEYTKGQ